MSSQQSDLDNFFTNEDLSTTQGTDYDLLDEKIKLICSLTGLPPLFKTREDSQYEARLSQCRCHRTFTVEKNDDRKYIINCTIETCKFRIVVSMTKANGTRIIGGNGEHTCDVNDHVINDKTSPAAHSKFLSKYLLQHICNGIRSNIELVKKVKEELGCDVSSSTINRTLNIVTDKYMYNQKEGFHLIHAYSKHINGRGGYVDIEFEHGNAAIFLGVDENDENVPTPSRLQFYRMFVSLKEQRQYSRNIEYICIDACHLKGPFGGVLMTATTLDPNRNLLVLAQAVLPTENLEHWQYFLYHLKNANIGDNIKFIMSDRDKGLMAGVRNNFPNIPHGKCLRHLTENFKKSFGSEMTYHVERMAWAYTSEEYLSVREEIINMNKGYEMIAWIDKNEPQMWCRALFPVSRFDVTTSNSVEIFYNVLNPVRHLPPLSLLLHIEEYVLVKAYARLKNAHTMDTKVSRSVHQLLQEESKQATYHKCNDTAGVAGIVHASRSGITKKFNVDIEMKTCSCGRYQERFIPCSHAVSFLTTMLRVQPEMHCGIMHSVDTLKALYTQENGHTSIPTVFADLHAIGSVPVDPPARKVQRGRKPTRRIESQSRGSKRKQKADAKVCPFCHQPGHVRTTCPALRNANTI